MGILRHDTYSPILWPDVEPFYACYVRDPLGEVTAVEENCATSGPGLLAQYGYDNLGDRVSLDRGNGVNTSYTYAPSSAFRLTSIAHSFPAAQSANNETITLSYNPADQIVSRGSSNSAYEWVAPGASRLTYGVNGLNQIAARSTYLSINVSNVSKLMRLSLARCCAAD